MARCETGYPAVGPVLAVTRSMTQRSIHLRYLAEFEEIIHIKRKPPTKRLSVKYVPALVPEEDPPITGLSMVNLFLSFIPITVVYIFLKLAIFLTFLCVSFNIVKINE
jgi:hypothetical protein